ncbi:MAG: YsnF/AvaK domain-containing protein [Gemmataceae bacterium]|nr:YsnF/AvaK domain-containing protein [Gemmataceae bacterium]
MATKKNDHTTSKDPEKSVDVPPYGSRNPDPLTDQPGSHPVETGVGAVLGGVASGLAVGAVGGPVGAVVGGIVGGAVGGGLAGKGVGELIDPTTQDNWLRDYFKSDKTASAGGRTEEHYRPAYRYGSESASRYEGRRFEDVETDLRAGYERDHGTSGVGWEHARGAVRDAFDRTIQLREERLKVSKHREAAGDVTVRKEVITENKQVTVPVEREEVVIERRPAHGTAAAGDIRAETIRVPVSEERVDVSKEAVVTEEVNVGKRKVTDQKTVGGTVKKEEVRVEETGNVDVKGNVKKTDKR